MFDRRLEIKTPQNLTIEERRAPTDDSIKLAKEYEEKILQSVAENLLCEANGIKFTVAISQNYMLKTTMLLKMTINDRSHFNVVQIQTLEESEVKQLVHDWVVSCITSNVFFDVAQEIREFQFKHYRFVGKHG